MSPVVRFGYVGTLVGFKGVHVLIDAFNQLRKRRPELRAELRIHGNLEWFPDYSRPLVEGADERIEFLGAFDNLEAHLVYASMDVLVVPSIWWENAPITIHEAIITGTPVITSDFGGMADFIKHGENGLLFRVGDAEDLSSKLEYLAEEPSRLAELRQPAVPMKTMASDAADMERRYERLLADLP